MPGLLCEHCTAVCCRYVALPLEEPETRRDFDDIRWYLLHEGISVFVEDGEWYINMATSCRHLQPDHRCGIYQTRPRICREYTTENCDYHSGDYGWDQHFSCPEHLDAYVSELFSKTGKTKSSANGKSSKKSSSSKNGKKPSTGRPGLCVKARRAPDGVKLAGAAADIAGVPLPVLGVRP